MYGNFYYNPKQKNNYRHYFLYTMIRIYTEPIFLPEKEYVFTVLFKEILGLDFSIHTSSVSRQYKIHLPNNATIEFRDAFFSGFSESVGYCSTDNIPKKITYLKDVLPEQTIPVLYGDASYNEINDQSLYCGVDIIAGAFFMLSRWEETSIEERDSFGRFPERLSLAVKHNFIQLPIVHIYAELFKKMATELGAKIQIKRTFKKTLTHDIDFMYKWMNSTDFLRTLCGDLCKRASIQTFKTSWALRKQKKDPYDTFDKLMTISEQIGTQSTFYFLLTPRNNKALASERGKQVISNIIHRNHSFGIHLNEWTEAEFPLIQKTITQFETIAESKITKSRQHFLKIQVPDTLRVLEQVGIYQDSSLYYRNNPGFRTGMCIEHSMFDCINRKIMSIKELPLILMDVSLQKYTQIEDAQTLIYTLIQTTKKYSGNFVCLWHNSSFDYHTWKNGDELYSYLIEI